MKKNIVKLAILLSCSLSFINTTVQAQDLSSILNLNQDQIALGLKEALEKGVDKQVIKLTQTDGFYRNELVKILLPEELNKIDATLRKMGMGNIADQGLLLINRAAEDAVKEATPIFVDAVKNITFDDAKNILLGDDKAATNYLEKTTSKNLYTKFAPVIQQSFEKVGANQIWNTIFTTYNALPLVSPVNTDLTDYVTQETMEGVFKMIAVEEGNIRANIGGSRSSQILKDVFGVLDSTSKESTNQSSEKNNSDNSSKKTIDLLKKINLF